MLTFPSVLTGNSLILECPDWEYEAFLDPSVGGEGRGSVKSIYGEYAMNVGGPRMSRSSCLELPSEG